MSTNTELLEMNQIIEDARPSWIEPIEVYDIASIQQGGCASGAYMPAVTYYTAKQTMNEYGDEVLDYIVDHYGELPKPADTKSWSGMAIFYLSLAVELWANQFDVDGLEY